MAYFYGPASSQKLLQIIFFNISCTNSGVLCHGFQHLPIIHRFYIEQLYPLIHPLPGQCFVQFQ